MGAAVALPAIASGIGLWQNHEASRRQRNAQNQANDLTNRAVGIQEDQYRNFTGPIQERLLAAANSYDPVTEGRAGVEQASAMAQDTIKKALSSLRADFAKGGGTPGQSSEYGVRAQGMTNRAADPLRMALAEAFSNPTMKRMNAYKMALGGSNPGQMSDTYFEAARNIGATAGPGGDFSGVGRMLSELLRKADRGRGGGGSGDMRGDVQTMDQNGMTYNNEWGY